MSAVKIQGNILREIGYVTYLKSEARSPKSEVGIEKSESGSQKSLLGCRSFANSLSIP